MVQGLIILSGAVPGIRDLMWVSGSNDGIGYAVFRSTNRYEWTRLTPYPIPGNRYRDEVRLDQKTHTVQGSDWVERGERGHWIFKLPEAPVYGEIQMGRALLASMGAHAQVTINGKPALVARVDGFEGTVWLANAEALMSDMGREAKQTTLPSEQDTVEVTYKTLGNWVDPTPETRSFYTVVPVQEGGGLAHTPGAPGSEVISTLEVDRMDYMQAEMVRRNAFLLEREGEPVYLMLRRSIGKHCQCASDTGPRTGCPMCYETGWVGGYYGPVNFLYLDPDSAATIEVEEHGVKTSRQSQSWCGPTPMLQSGDMLIRRNGERLVVESVIYKAPRGILLQQNYTTELIRTGDTRYRVPLVTDLSQTYHPAFALDAVGEPVSNPLNDPTKTWENDRVPVGRTVIFGNIQT